MKALRPGAPSFSIFTSLGQLGLIGFILIIILFGGRFSPASFAALGLALGISNILFAFASGLLSVQDAFISWAIGADEAQKINLWFLRFLFIAMVCSVAMFCLMMMVIPVLHFVISSRETLFYAEKFTIGLAWSLPLQVLFHCYRVYYQSVGRPQLPTLLMWSGNVLLVVLTQTHSNLSENELCKMVFISRGVMLVAMVICTGHSHLLSLVRTHYLERSKMREILRLALPASFQMLLEGGLFFLLFFFAAQFDVQTLGLQSVLANLVNFVFAVPYGLSISSANEIGRLVGENDISDAKRNGSAKIKLTVLIMAIFSALWFFAGQFVLRELFSQSAFLPLLAVSIVVGCFQVADGLQVVLTGLLRGFGDTKTSMMANAIGHWMIGLPIAYGLGIHFHLGIVGLWIGLAAGFSIVAMALFAKWMKIKSRLKSWGYT